MPVTVTPIVNRLPPKRESAIHAGAGWDAVRQVLEETLPATGSRTAYVAHDGYTGCDWPAIRSEIAKAFDARRRGTTACRFVDVASCLLGGRDLDALNPVQTSAAGMGLARLKRDFGKDITFWGGGIDIRRLPSLTVAEIRDEVATAIDIMAPGGGFVFAASHNILPETSGEKTDAAYLAAVRTWKERHGG